MSLSSSLRPFALSLVLFGTSSIPVFADDVITKAPLEGGVQKVTLSLEQLRDAGLDLKNLLKAITSLYDEVTIQPVSMVMEPEVVGRGMVISIPVATQAVGPPQPPRKSRVDSAMAGIKPSITTMKSDLDAFASGKEQLDLPADLLNKMTPQIQNWSAVVDDLSARLTQLETLTAGPTYDNAAIAATTTAMEKDVKDLDETRRAVYKEVRDEGKHKHHL